MVLNIEYKSLAYRDTLFPRRECLWLNRDKNQGYIYPHGCEKARPTPGFHKYLNFDARVIFRE